MIYWNRYIKAKTKNEISYFGVNALIEGKKEKKKRLSLLSHEKKFLFSSIAKLIVFILLR